MRIFHKQNIIRLIVLLCIIMLPIAFMGCGDTNIDSESQLVEKQKFSAEITDILSENWKVSLDEPIALEGWEIVQYVPDFAKATNEDYSLYMNSTILGEAHFWSLLFLEEIEEGIQNARYELMSADLDKAEIKSVWQSLSDLNFSSIWDNNAVEQVDKMLLSGQAAITAIDTDGTDFILFLVMRDDHGIPVHLYKIAVRPDNTVTSVTDYIAFVEVEVDDEGYFLVPELICGAEGNTYWLDYDKKEIALIDAQGTNICTIDARDMMRTIKCIGKSSKGIPVFSYTRSNEETEFFYIDSEGKHVLYSGKVYSGVYSVDKYGDVLVLNGNRLLNWKVSTGETSLIYDFGSLDGYVCMGLAKNDSGEILVCFESGDDAFIYRLNDIDHPDIKELVILQDGEYPYIEKCAADYSRTHPEVRIRVEQIDLDDTYTLNKLVSTLKEEGGPDLILADRKQLDVFKSAGVISPLDNIISEKITTNMFKGALQIGTFDNDLYAIPCEANLTVWMIADENWKENTWTLDEVKKQYLIWKNTFDARRFLAINYGLDSQKLFLYLCVKNIELSEFVDVEKGTCNFETESFYELLKFCRTNSDGDEYLGRYISVDECIAEMINNEAFAYYFEGGLVDYSYIRKKLGDDYHAVGDPTANDVRSIVSSYHAVAVNALSQDKDIASDFIAALVGEEYQSKYTIYWVRRDIVISHIRNAWELHKHTVNGVEEDNNPAFEINKRLHVPMEGRDDGTSYVDEYISLMDAGLPASVEYEIKDILLEEISYYFLGDKSEEEVARVIQSRVQLYLDEQG